eukprot:9087283-Pyramimonas_sp.AAC.1
MARPDDAAEACDAVSARCQSSGPMVLDISGGLERRDTDGEACDSPGSQGHQLAQESMEQ